MKRLATRTLTALTLGLALTTGIAANSFAGVIQLQVDSAGFDSATPPGFAHLLVDGTDVFGPVNARGIHVGVLDATTGTVLDRVAFDTHGSAAASAAFAAYVAGITSGQIVMVGVQDEATNNLSTAARSALASLGASSNNISSGGYRGSYALIGIAGAGVGNRVAFEAIGGRYAPYVTVTDQITVPAPLSVFMLGLGLAAMGWRKRAIAG